MIEYNRFLWWRNTFSWRGTALPLSYRRVLLATVYCVAVQALYNKATSSSLLDETSLQLDPVGHTVVGSMIGFLIVFRMNASNVRYWEGRCLWGQIINASRNLVRVGSQYTREGDELAGLVTGYVISVRRLLRGQRDTEEAELYLPSIVREDAATFGNPPTAVSAAITAWIARHRKSGELDPELVRHLEVQLSSMVDAQGGCERIQKTPLPFAYVAMIKQLVLVYLMTLPLVLCSRYGWWSPLMMAVLSLGLLGMEEASVEIEDPFGTHPNCLDMENYTLTIARDTGQLADLAERRQSGDHPAPSPVSGFQG